MRADKINTHHTIHTYIQSPERYHEESQLLPSPTPRDQRWPWRWDSHSIAATDMWKEYPLIQNMMYICMYVCMYVSIYGRIYVTYTPIYLWIYYWPNNSRFNWSKNVCSMNVGYIHAGIPPCIVRIMNAFMHYLSLWMYVIKCIRRRVLTWMPSELTATPMLCWRFLETPT